jgi:hypothetical protein
MSRRYRFGEVSVRGILGHIRTGQVIAAVLGAIWAIAMLDLSPSGAGALAAALGMIAATVVATVPIGGLTIEQWLPVGLAWMVTLLTGQTAGGREAAVDGTVVALPTASRVHKTRVIRGPRPSPPRELADVRITSVPYRGRPLGVITERGGRRLTLLMVGRAPGFALADESEQQQRLAIWGDVLKGASRGAIRRIGWVERTAPAQGDGLARWLHEQRDPKVPLNGPLGRSYLELMDSSAQATREHQVVLAVQIDASLLHKDMGKRREQALISAAERVAQMLQRARVQIDGALTAGGIARVLRAAFDPYALPQLAALRAASGTDELSEAAAWPAGTKASWDHYRCDGALHATFEISGWPRAEVGPAFLGPLLGPSDQVRSIAVTFEPLDPLRSLRQAEHEITRDETDRQTRRRFGQVETSRQRQASEAARQREAELASGHNEARLAGFVTVSARDLEDLDVACEEVTAQAGRANLELRRFYGQQSKAFTFTLPLCRGLR